jgi:dipeptidyl aminopeptidase/acylaminoacyl peptidase
MAGVIRKNGGKVKYIVYEGEGHGWKKAANIGDALVTEIDWYKETFGLPIVR